MDGYISGHGAQPWRVLLVSEAASLCLGWLAGYFAGWTVSCTVVR